MSPIPDEAVRALARQSMAMIMAELDAHDAGGKATGSAVVFISLTNFPPAARCASPTAHAAAAPVKRFLSIIPERDAEPTPPRTLQ